MKSVKLQNKLVFGILFLFLVLTMSNVSAAVGGLSEARIQSNYFGFDKAWIVDFVSDDFTTDKINAFFTPSDFESESGQKTKQSLSISAQTRPNSVEWSLKQDTSRPDVFELVPFTDSKWSTNYDSAKSELSAGCFDLPGDDYYWKGTFGKVTVWCLKANKKLATSGEFVGEFIRSETDWSVTASGKTPQTALVTNTETGNGRTSKLGDRVYVQWQGLAITGESPPPISNSIPLHSNDFSGGWRVVKLGNYDSYVNYLSNSFNDVDRWANGRTTESNLRDILSSKSYGAIQQDLSFGTFSVLDQRVDGGKIRLDLGRLITFPQFRLIIDADYLELDIQTGVPQIVSTSNIKFNEGSAGSMNVRVKNIGSSKGGFNVRILDCSNGFSSNTPSQGITLEPNEERTLTFEIIGSSTSTQGTLTGSCNVEMKESITQQIVKKSFSIEMNQIKECPPPQFACGVENNIHVIKECNSQGTGLVTIEKCASDEICSLTSSGAECKKEVGIEKGFFANIFDGIKNFFKGIFNFTGGIFSVLRNMVTIIAGLFALLFGADLFNKFKAINKNKLLVWSFALLTSIAISYIIYRWFYVGLVIFTIFVLLKFTIGFSPIGRLKK